MLIITSLLPIITRFWSLMTGARARYTRASWSCSRALGWLRSCPTEPGDQAACIHGGIRPLKTPFSSSDWYIWMNLKITFVSPNAAQSWSTKPFQISKLCMFCPACTSILGRLPVTVVQAGDTGTIQFKYRTRCRNGAHRYDHTLARADSRTWAGDRDGCSIHLLDSWATWMPVACGCLWSRDP